MATPDVLGAAGEPRPADDLLAAAKRHLPGTTAILDPAGTGGRRHILAAARHARRAHQAGRDRCRDPAMEVLLHAAGTDQIEEALDRVGLDGTVDVVAIVPMETDEGVTGFLDAVGFARDDEVLDVPTEQAREVARRRGHGDVGDAVDWLVEDAAQVALG